MYVYIYIYMYVCIYIYMYILERLVASQRPKSLRSLIFQFPIESLIQRKVIVVPDQKMDIQLPCSK